ESKGEEIGIFDKIAFETPSKDAVANISIDNDIIIYAETWHLICVTLSKSAAAYGFSGKSRLTVDGVDFEFRNSVASSASNIPSGQIPEIYFEKNDAVQKLKQIIKTLTNEKEQMRIEIERQEKDIAQMRAELAEHATWKTQLITAIDKISEVGYRATSMPMPFTAKRAHCNSKSMRSLQSRIYVSS
ncbi:hypothetical protein PMAYCL1PPCAC_08849, partial [Pristionchus mayeri]